LLALEDPRTDYEVYNVGGAGPLSALDYANVVREVVGLERCAETPGLYRFGDTRHVVSDIGRLSRLGWSPTLGVEAIVREYVEWVMDAGHIDSGTDESMGWMLQVNSLRRASSPFPRFA
jgi:dTDP-L-rhamnose 4-epimerase